MRHLRRLLLPRQGDRGGGRRLLPEGEVTEIQDATLKRSNGHEARVTMHMLEGTRKEIERQLKQSLNAFFDFYPEI